MKRALSTDDLLKLTIADITAAWKAQSEGMDHRHPAFPYTFHAQYNANVKNYLPVAVDVLLHHNNSVFDADITEPAEGEASEMMLITVIDQDVDELANAARAAFLNQRHGYDLQMALTSTTAELGIDRKTAKAANGVAEGVRRVLRFFRIWLTTCPSVLIKSKWPIASKESRRSKASFLMGRIRTEMVGRGVLDPNEATPKMIAEALTHYTEKAHSTGDSRHWNCALRDLRIAVIAGHYPGVTEFHLSELTEIRPNPRNPARTISEAELVRQWPEEFPCMTGDPTHLDPEKGIPGFYNKELGGKAPLNPAGEHCPPERQLHRKAHKGRFGSIRRDIFRSLEDAHGSSADISIADLFNPECIKKRLLSQIEEKGKVLHTHRDGYMHALMLAKYYFGYDVADLVNWVKQNVNFPKDWESTRSEKALRSGTPQSLIEQAESMGLYSESAQRLSEKELSNSTHHCGAGQYLIRKAGQVDCWLRILTGLRPAALDALEVSNSADRSGTSPKIWQADDGHYLIFIPLRWMKQHLVNIWGKNRVDFRTKSADHEVKGFEFEIRRPAAVKALDEYFNHGWSRANAVLEKRTCKLYLNTKGEACKEGAFPKAFQSLRTEVYHFMLKRHGRETQRHDRYQVRHIMSTFIETHLPGRNLKTTYLTHSADFGSDRLYGKTNMALLREVLDEVLDGKPTKLQQQEEREMERDEQVRILNIQIAELTKALTEKPTSYPSHKSLL